MEYYYKKEIARISSEKIQYCNSCNSELNITFGYKRNTINKCTNENCISHKNIKKRWFCFYDYDIFLRKFEKNKEKTANKYTTKQKEYWLQTGFTEIEAKNIISESQINASKCVKNRDNNILKISYWLNKGVSEVDAKIKISKIQKERSPRCVEYWLKKGYDEITSELKVSEYQKETSLKNNIKWKNKKDTFEYRKRSIRCLEYYLSRGYSIEESKKTLKENQTTFSLEKSIIKYGLEKGTEIYNTRQKNWVKKMFNENTSMAIGRSIMSDKFIEILINSINNPTITDSFLYGKNEKFIYDNLEKKGKRYDLYYNKKIIEFNGDFWHGNPKLFEANDIHRVTKKKISDIWKIDERKIESAKEHGCDILVIWESDYINNKDETINKCKKFLINEENNK